MATNPERYWYVFNNRLAFVEKNGLVTTDGQTSEYKTITESKPVRIHAISKADHFTTGATTEDKEMSSSKLGPLGDIPIQFHEGLVFKVIAMGYKTPPALDVNLAQYFDMEYEKVVKQGKKFAKSNYIQTGMIAPQDF
tara:strand:- start:16 stop:429 length:414 start_codon:yes stop_codon:yes gene_type:complete